MRVALISLPFAPLNSPSAALGILHAIAESSGHEVNSYHFAPRFAARIGTDLYSKIADGYPSTSSLVGEWCFSAGTHTHPAKSANAFLRSTLEEHQMPNEKFIEDIELVKNEVVYFLHEAAREVAKFSPSVIGLTSVFQQTSALLAFAEIYKKLDPGAYIVAGGANFEDPMGTIFLKRYTQLDAVVSGEGEPAWIEILSAKSEARPLRFVPGLHTRRLTIGAAKTEFVDLNSLPEPNYDNYFWEISRWNIDIRTRLPFETSRGCWWGAKSHCTFCGLNGNSMTFRNKDAKIAYDQLINLIQKYTPSAASAVDNIIPHNYFKSFVPLLINGPVSVPIFYETKANLSRHDVEALAAAGITHIQPGIESLSDTILSIMKKGVSALQNIYLLKLCREFNILVEWNFIWGFPSEPPAEYSHMAVLVQSLTHFQAPGGWGTLRLDRFSPLHTDREKNGIKNVRPAKSYGEIFQSVPDEELENIAYYFSFDYADRRNPGDYTSDLTLALKAWANNATTSELLLVDKGDLALIWDTRPYRFHFLHVLKGELLDVYRLCNQPASINSLATKLELSEAIIHIIISTLVNRRLMIRVGNRAMSLAISINNYQPKRTALDALAKVFKNSNKIKSATHDHTITIPTASNRVLSAVNILTQRGAHELNSGGRSLFDHLIGVWLRLSSSSCAEHIALAGLTHSIYGSKNIKPLFDVELEREIVASTIGHAAEEIVHSYYLNRQGEKFEAGILKELTESNLRDIAEFTCPGNTHLDPRITN